MRYYILLYSNLTVMAQIFLILHDARVMVNTSDFMTYQMDRKSEMIKESATHLNELPIIWWEKLTYEDKVTLTEFLKESKEMDTFRERLSKFERLKVAEKLLEDVEEWSNLCTWSLPVFNRIREFLGKEVSNA